MTLHAHWQTGGISQVMAGHGGVQVGPLAAMHERVILDGGTDDSGGRRPFGWTYAPSGQGQSTVTLRIEEITASRNVKVHGHRVTLEIVT
jgi:hypothetical protein